MQLTHVKDASGSRLRLVLGRTLLMVSAFLLFVGVSSISRGQDRGETEEARATSAALPTAEFSEHDSETDPLPPPLPELEESDADDAPLDDTAAWALALEARGNYYWETSTRVVAPEFAVDLTTPSGTQIGADVLLDAITSASLASGARVDRRFTETRWQGGVNASHEFAVGENHLEVSGGFSASKEPDYLSLGGSLGGKLSLDERNTMLSLSASFVRDEIKKKLRGADRNMDGRDLSDRGVVGTMKATSIGASVEQLLSPTMFVIAGYDFGYIDGFQSNPYRSVALSAAGVLVDELHPEVRSRHNVHGRFAIYLPATQTAFHLLGRVYADSWDLRAITPELRIYQEFGDVFMVRGRYRYYRQSPAEFAADDYVPDPNDPETVRTADPKMAGLTSHLIGGELVVHLDFLERTALDFAWKATLDFSANYLINKYDWQNNGYGSGVLAQVGLRVPVL